MSPVVGNYFQLQVSRSNSHRSARYFPSPSGTPPKPPKRRRECGILMSLCPQRYLGLGSDVF